MADLRFQPVRHDHKAFLEKASKRPSFSEAYEALKIELLPLGRKRPKGTEIYKRDTA